MRIDLSKEELTALRAILGICTEQYETSGGDIDYAGLGERSPQVMADLAEKLTEKEVDGEEEIYVETTEFDDMTFIMRDVFHMEGRKKVVDSTEVVGFYYGSPTAEDNEKFMGKLKAEF